MNTALIMRGLQWPPVARLALLRWSSDSKRLNSKQFLIVVQKVNYSGAIVWGNFMGCNFPEDCSPGGNYSGAITRGAKAWEAIVLGGFHGGAPVRVGSCPGVELFRGKYLVGKGPGDNCPRGNFIGENCPGGNYQGGNCH